MTRHLTVRADHGVPVVTFPSEIDGRHVEDFRRELTTVLLDAPPRLVLNLSATRSCDEPGMQMLLTVADEARRNRVHLSMVITQPEMRLLVQRAAGEDADLVVLCLSLDDALADHRVRSAARRRPDGPAVLDPPTTSLRLALDADVVPVTGVYVDEDTEVPCWIAVRTGHDGRDGERLVPFARVRPVGVEGLLRSSLPSSVVRSAPPVYDAPPRLCDCDEDPVCTHYAEVPGHAPEPEAQPSTCSPRRSVRVDDIDAALAGLVAAGRRNAPPG